MRILLTNVYDMYNRGEVSTLTSLVESLPGSEFMIAPLYSFINKEVCRDLGIKVSGRTSPYHASLLLFWSILTLSRALLWTFLRRMFRISLSCLLNRELKAYLDADFIVDLGGDNFSDETGFGGSIVHSYSLIFAILFNKRFIICSQSIGPFKTHFTKFIAEFILTRASLITVREPITLRYLCDDLGINNGHLHETLDLAFIMEKTEAEESRNFLREKGVSFDKPLICVNPSQLISKYIPCDKDQKYEFYIGLLANMIDRLPDDASIVLIPNVVDRPVQSKGPFKNVDDRLAVKAVLEKLKKGARVHVINEDLDPQQIKSIIGLADLFIGCRMHAIISALSVGTPTIALAYSRKTLGLAESLGLEEYLIDIRHHDPHTLEMELLAKINTTWKNRLMIKETLQRRSREWKQRAFMNIELIHQLRDEQKHNTLIGSYVNCWIGQSTNESVRKNASSGGIVTTLLIFALRNKMINGALVTKSCGVKPKVFLAEDERQVRSASSSKYCPVPLLASLIETTKKNGRFAVVGLPCHIRAIRKLEASSDEMRKKIVIHIGLFCAHRVSFSGTKFLLKSLGIKPEDVVELVYRSKNGKDTGMLIRTKDGFEKFIPSKKYWSRFLNFFFVPFSCLKCKDMTSELADISVGDAWLSELKSTGSENCVLMSRNDISDDFVKSAMAEGLIKCEKTSSKTVVRSQKLYLHLKKRTGLLAFCFLAFLNVCSIVSLRLRFYPLLSVWIRIFRVTK